MSIRARTSGMMVGGMSEVAVTTDAATSAWVAAVIANGGTVSAARRTLVNTLIAGLKTDGLFTQLDRLWLFAGEDTPSALTDIIATALATNVLATTFTIDRGYTGDGISMYINSNFNPTVSSPHFVQNSACAFAWNGTTGAQNGGLFGTDGTTRTVLYPEFGDNNCYWGVNDSGLEVFANTSATGLYLINRTASNSQTLDLNGGQIRSGTDASVAPDTTTFVILHDGGFYSSRQVSCFGCGSGLTPTNRISIYSRLRTYMTAVGVP